MKLMRVGEPGKEKPALLDKEGKIRDLSAHVADIGGEAIHPDSLAKLAQIDPATLPELAAGRIGACVAGTGKFICIGLNFSDHAAETGATVPPEPIIFMKATSAIAGPNDTVLIPRGSEKQTGKSNSASSSARRLSMSAKPTHSIMSPATAFRMTSRSALSRRSAPASGPRESPATHSARSAPGWSRRMKLPIRKISACG